MKPFPGREAKALEVHADCRVFFGKLAAEGKVTEPMVFTSFNDGMMIVSGDMAFMFDLMNSDDFVLLLDKCMFVAEGFEYHLYNTGELMEHRLGLYAKAGMELAYL